MQLMDYALILGCVFVLFIVLIWFIRYSNKTLTNKLTDIKKVNEYQEKTNRKMFDKMTELERGVNTRIESIEGKIYAVSRATSNNNYRVKEKIVLPPTEIESRNRIGVH
ncbi:MAG: hypothetical protein ABIE23_00785 [archaeon]